MPSPRGLKGSGAHSDCAQEQERGTGVSKHCGFVCFLFQQRLLCKKKDRTNKGNAKGAVD